MDAIDVLISKVMRDAERTNPRMRPHEWTAEEDDFLLKNMDRMGIDKIAEALGRSPVAVKIHFTRKEMPAPSKFPGWLTGNQAAKVLGIDGHKVTRWMDIGIMPGERLKWSTRVIRRVSWIRLKMWLIKPETWIYIRAERIKNPYLRGLVLRAQARWGDEWWSSRQAEDYLHGYSGDMKRMVLQGKIQGLQAVEGGGRNFDPTWSLWFFRRSDVEKLVIPRRRGHAIREWPARADEFMLRAHAEGKTCAEIARLMRSKRYEWNKKNVDYRVRQLRKGMQ